MAYEINWSLLGQPVDVGGAVHHGFQVGSALRQRQDEEARHAEFTRSAFAAIDPQTGAINAPAMRSAFRGAGDIQGALGFEQQQSQAATQQQAREREQLTTMARLLDEATDEPSYQRGLQIAQRMGIDVSGAPPNFDPAFVAQQRQIVHEFIERPEQTTSFLREAQALGLSPEQTREAWLNRYAPPMQAVDVTNPDGSVTRQYIPRPQGGSAPPRELTTEELDALEHGGPAPAAGAGTFP